MLSKLNITRRLILLVFLIQIGVAIIVGLLFQNSHDLMESTDWVIHTEKALERISTIEKHIVDLETGQRGFLITGKESYLEPFKKSKESIFEELEQFKILTSDNSKQTQEVEILSPILRDKIAELEQTIALRRNTSYEAAKAVVDTDLGKNLMDEIMLHTGHLRDEELRLLDIRVIAPDQARINTNRTLIVVLILNLIFIVFMSIIFLRSIKHPLDRLKLGINEIEKGHLTYRIGEYTEDEIGQVSKSFDRMLDHLASSKASNVQLKEEIDKRKEIEKLLIDKNTREKEINEELKSQETALRNSNKELEQFAYLTSHDLQEPLKTIEMFTRLSTEELDELNHEKLNSYVDIINHMTHNMSQKINDLLQYSRLGKHRESSDVDMNILMEDVLDMLKMSINQSNAHIHVSQLHEVRGNYTELSLLMQNLLSNALKFVEQDQAPVIEITSEQNKLSTTFSVKDDGIGIDSEHFDQIFHMFKRLHLEGNYEGTGIGLAQCQKIVQLHDGEIWVKSKEGEGTTFYFSIPNAIA